MAIYGRDGKSNIIGQYLRPECHRASLGLAPRIPYHTHSGITTNIMFISGYSCLVSLGTLISLTRAVRFHQCLTNRPYQHATDCYTTLLSQERQSSLP